MTLCNTCSKKKECTALCQEAELYVSKDEISLQEVTYGLEPKFEPRPWPEGKEKPLLTPTEHLILNALFQGKTRKQICKLLNITADSLRVHLSNIRKKR